MICLKFSCETGVMLNSDITLYFYNCSFPSNSNDNNNNTIHDTPLRNKVGNIADYLEMKLVQVVCYEE